MKQSLLLITLSSALLVSCGGTTSSNSLSSSLGGDSSKEETSSSAKSEATSSSKENEPSSSEILSSSEASSSGSSSSQAAFDFDNLPAKSLELTPSLFPSDTGSGYVPSDFTTSEIGFHSEDTRKGAGEYDGTIQIRKESGEIYNTTAIEYNCVIITLMDTRSTYNTYMANLNVAAGSSSHPTENPVAGENTSLETGKVTFAYVFSNKMSYFSILNNDTENARAAYAYSIYFANI